MSDEALTKRDAAALEKKASRKIRNAIARITRNGLKEFEAGLGDKVTPYAERTVATAFAHEVYKQTMANSREVTKAAASLGIVLTQARMKDSEWESRCQEDEDRRNATAIDAEVIGK